MRIVLRALLSAVVAALMIALSPAAAPANVDTSPPSKPTGLRDNCIADFPGAAFCWNPSTDDVAVTGYDVYRQTPSGLLKVGTAPATSFPLFGETGLVTYQTYIYRVQAKDAAGNLSVISDPVSVVARPGMPVPPSCRIEYTTTTFNSTGFFTQVKITNTGGIPMNSWTLTFAFPTTGQQITSGFSAMWTQNGVNVTARNMPWNAVIQPTSSVYIGFYGSHANANPVPAQFRVNGVLCTV
ncbi:hypothetical protein Aph01nite_47440 [Acrocarpospora phusangensis]|uniref:CBM2 domain-containing protein n=1 Tax=Acrocarpospora phusangensis TaxID=1070424 RepID=A0A919ULY2_9ACTN|nr:cellulose binding domain-containing protein [Acrocarpospora phusangensis]GIH26434.1 hypothetical protein Aph01nite_47440 [Acrocarpospora phusangensis]